MACVPLHMWVQCSNSTKCIAGIWERVKLQLTFLLKSSYLSKFALIMLIPKMFMFSATLSSLFWLNLIKKSSICIFQNSDCLLLRSLDETEKKNSQLQWGANTCFIVYGKLVVKMPWIKIQPSFCTASFHIAISAGNCIYWSPIHLQSSSLEHAMAKNEPWSLLVCILFIKYF